MFDRLSIRHKLIILLSLSAALALLISAMINVYVGYRQARQDALRVLQQMSVVLAENMQAALAFDDAESARKMLEPLQADKHILFAEVRNTAGKVLGSYRVARLDEARLSQLQLRLQQEAQPVQRFKDLATVTTEDSLRELKAIDILGVEQAIHFDRQLIGHLSVVSDTDLIWQRMREILWIQLATSLLTLLLLFVLSIRLQALFTRPILRLIGAMQEVSRSRNYQLSLSTRARDEFGDLYRGFSDMLAVIRERDERLSQLATTDALTDLTNRRQALETMQQMLVRAQRKQEPLGVIMLDIDHFKSVNDQYGHAVGDLVLKAIARVLQGSAREYDLVARLGGEEFLLVCDHADRAVSLEMAERVRLAIAACRVERAPNEWLQVTASLGIYAAVPVTDSRVEQLLKQADDALYQAKREGRNRCVVV